MRAEDIAKLFGTQDNFNMLKSLLNQAEVVTNPNIRPPGKKDFQLNHKSVYERFSHAAPSKAGKPGSTLLNTRNNNTFTKSEKKMLVTTGDANVDI